LNKDDDKSHFFNKTKKWIIDKYTNDDDEEGEEEDEDEESTGQSIFAKSTPKEQEAEKPVMWSYRNYNDMNAMKLLRPEPPKATLSSIKHKIDWYLTKADKNTSFIIERDVLKYWREKEQQLPMLARLA